MQIREFGRVHGTTLVCETIPALERLPFVPKNPVFFGWNVKWNGSTRWKFSGIKGIPSKVFLFFRFNRNDRDKLYQSHSCHSLTHGRRLCEPGTSRPSLPSSIGRYSIVFWPVFNGRNKLFRFVPKNPTRKFHANGKRSIPALLSALSPDFFLLLVCASRWNYLRVSKHSVDRVFL